MRLDRHLNTTTDKQRGRIAERDEVAAKKQAELPQHCGKRARLDEQTVRDAQEAHRRWALEMSAAGAAACAGERVPRRAILCMRVV
eukprot:gene4320-2952_t